MFLWICSAIALFSSFDLEMTAREKKQTGISKLTSREKTALLSWIESREKTASPKKIPQKKQPYPLMQESLNNGKFLGLSDSSFWEVDPEDIPIAQGWISAVEIIIEPSDDTAYPFTLTNSLTGSAIKTRKITKKEISQNHLSTKSVGTYGPTVY